ncbi:MAG TPA: phage tail tape measure protein [Macromonas sp.]|nr:phage tail tape measure protein [Macromonas sp.]
MADASKTIDLIFNGIDKTGAATQAALSNLEKFAGSAQVATQPLADFTMGAVKLEAGLLTAGVAMTAFAVKVAGDFDSAFRQISTLFDASAEDTARFRDEIAAYAAQSGKSMEDLMSALGAAIGSGVDYRDSLDLIATAEKLSIATRADLTGTTEVLVSTMNAYGMSTKDAGALADLMFQIIKDGKIEMSDLSASLASVTPLAAAAGVSMKEVGGAIAVLTAAGMQPSSAIDALKSAIANIVKPSEQAKDMAAQLGIQFDVNALKSKGLAGVLQDVAVKTGGSAEKMAVLFGDVNGLSAVLSLTGPQAEKFGETIANMGNSAGAVAEAYGKMAGSMDISVQKVINSFMGLMTQIGTPLLNEFGGVSQAIAAMFTALGNSVKDGALGDLVGYIEGLFGDLEKSLQAVAKNLPAALQQADLSGFKNGVDAIVQAFKSLFGSIDLTTVDGLTKAIELAGAGFLGLSKYVAGVIETFEPLFNTLLDVASGLKDADSGIFEFAGNLGGIATQVNLLAGGVNSLLPSLEALLNIVLLKQGAGLVGGFGKLAGALAGAGGVVGLLGQAGLVGAAGAAGYAVGNLLVDPIDNLVSKLTGTRTTLGGLIYDLTHTGEAAELAGNKADAAAGKFERLKFASGGGGQFEGYGASGSWDEVTDAVEGTTDALEGYVEVETRTQFSTAARTALMKYHAEQLDKVAGAQKEVTKYVAATVPIYDEVTGKIVGYEQRLVAASDAAASMTGNSGKATESINKVAGATDKATEAQRKWNEELTKMNHAETMELIKRATEISVAQIEATTQRMQAAFESINATINSTGDLLGTLFTGLDKLSGADYSLVKDQIELENQRRQEALDLQKELTVAQIDEMRARTAAMVNGDALIKIDGAGLQPHLEAFMWEILRTIQTRVNKDGLELLVGA